MDDSKEHDRQQFKDALEMVVRLIRKMGVAEGVDALMRGAESWTGHVRSIELKGKIQYIRIGRVLAKGRTGAEYVAEGWDESEQDWTGKRGLILNENQIPERTKPVPRLTQIVLWGRIVSV